MPTAHPFPRGLHWPAGRPTYPLAASVWSHARSALVGGKLHGSNFIESQGYLRCNAVLCALDCAQHRS